MMRRPLPMMARIFAAMVAMVMLGSWTFGAVLGIHQDRSVVATVLPLYAAAIRAMDADVPGSTWNQRTVQLKVDVQVGSPPGRAYDVSDDPRTALLMQALRDTGLDIRQVRLDGDASPAVTWLSERQTDASGQSRQRWIGIAGGVQPGDLRSRYWWGVGALLALVLLTAWFVSRWVARPLARLSEQVEGLARGEALQEPVRGAREIGHLGAALWSMARQREAFEAQRRIMLMGISHDIRSPLTRIRVAADLLDNGKTMDTSRLAQLIARNVEQADAIIAGFSSYLRAEAEPVNDTVDLGTIVRSAGQAAGLAPDQISTDGAPVTVLGNTLLLQRLLGNLLDNAERHGRGPLALGLDRDLAAGTATVWVDDAGPGIADPERMVQPFERGDAARSTGGSGLGLAIAAKIAERHRGALSISRSSSGGARVGVRLPWAKRKTS